MPDAGRGRPAAAGAGSAPGVRPIEKAFIVANAAWRPQPSQGLRFLLKLVCYESMDAFIAKHADKLQGTLSCFDRVLFRGYLLASACA